MLGFETNAVTSTHAKLPKPWCRVISAFLFDLPLLNYAYILNIMNNIDNQREILIMYNI